MATECRETFAGALARPTPIDFTASTNDDGATSLASVIRYGKQAVKFLGVFSQEVGSHTSADVALAVHHDSYCVQTPDVVREGEWMWMVLWGFSAKEREVVLDARLVVDTACAKVAQLPLEFIVVGWALQVELCGQEVPNVRSCQSAKRRRAPDCNIQAITILHYLLEVLLYVGRQVLHNPRSIPRVASRLGFGLRLCTCIGFFWMCYAQCIRIGHNVYEGLLFADAVSMKATTPRTQVVLPLSCGEMIEEDACGRAIFGSRLRC